MSKVWLLLLALAITFNATAGGTGAGSQQDPIQVAPNNYKVVFENERVRVLSFHAAPGEKWGLHAHPDAVVISMSAYKVRNVVPGADPVVRDAKTGNVLWIPARLHTGENAGSSDMDCILVELKETKK